VRKIASHALERQAIADALLDTGADHHPEQARSPILPAVQDVMNRGAGTPLIAVGTIFVESDSE
jgi:hypothetical protein